MPRVRQISAGPASRAYADVFLGHGVALVGPRDPGAWSKDCAEEDGYLTDLGVSRDVVVTDGMRYRLHASERGFQEAAYANLVRLKRPALEFVDRLRCP